MIVVTGATGKLGRLVVEELLKKLPPRELAVVVRTPAKAADLAARGVEVRQGDYARPETLVPALAGAEKILLISSSEVGRRTAQHAAVIDAARTAAPRLLAYTSLLHADTARMGLAAEHKATEAAIRASGLPFVFLRNGWYLENYTENLAPALAARRDPGERGRGPHRRRDPRRLRRGRGRGDHRRRARGQDLRAGRGRRVHDGRARGRGLAAGREASGVPGPPRGGVQRRPGRGRAAEAGRGHATPTPTWASPAASWTTRAATCAGSSDVPPPPPPPPSPRRSASSAAQELGGGWTTKRGRLPGGSRPRGKRQVVWVYFDAVFGWSFSASSSRAMVTSSPTAGPASTTLFQVRP